MWKVNMQTYGGGRPNEPHAMADAKTFGLLEKLNCGVCAACEISAWDDEEPLAWLEALQRHVRIEALETIED
jgi:hypothetical protein